MKQIGFAIIISVIMMGVGYFLHPSFFRFSVDLLAIPGSVRLSSTNIVTESPFVFVGTMGFLPLFYFLLYKLAPLRSIKEGIFSVALMLIGGTVVWWIRIKFISDQLIDQSVSYNLRGYDYNYLPADQLKFSLFFGMGVLIGMLLAFVIISSIYSSKQWKVSEF